MYSRIRLLILAGYAVFVVACIAFALRVSQLERDAVLREAERQTEALAIALGERFAAVLRGADVLLLDLADEIANAGGLGHYPAAALHERLALHAGRVPEVGGMVAYRADLAMHANSFSPDSRGLVGAGDERIEVHRKGDSGRLVIGPPMFGPISGTVLIPVSRRLNAPDGGFAGVIGASLPLESFTAFLPRLRLEAGAGLVVLRDDGRVLVRLPGSVRPDENLRESTVFRSIPAPDGSATLEAEVPGRFGTQVVSLFRHGEFPFVVALARDRATLLAGWHRSFATRAALLVLLLAVSGGLAIVALWRLKASLAAESELRAAREALRERDARLAAFFRSSPVAHAVVREGDQAFVDVNEAWARMYGLPREAAIGRSAIALGIWEIPAHRTRFFALVERDGSARDVPVRLVRRNGEAFEARLSAQTVSWEGAPHVVVSTLDVSAEARAQQARQQSEERFARFFEANPIALTLTRLMDGHCLNVNEAAEALTGYARAEAVGSDRIVRALWSDPEERERYVRELLAHGRVRDFEVRLRRKPGELRDCSISAERLDLDGVPCILASISDVTERRAVERALREGEERFERLFRSSPVAHSLIRAADGRYVDVNDAWVRTFGFAREEAIGRTAVEIGAWESADAQRAFAARLAERGYVRGERGRRRRRSGELFDAVVSAEAIELQGEPYRVTSVLDVTAEARALEEVHRLNETLEHRVRERTAELESANRELEAFSYSVAHDLRAPVRAVAGFSEIVRREHAGQLDAEGRRLLERVSGAARQIGSLIDALLELSRVARRPVKRQTVDLSALAAQVIEALRERSPERAVEVRIAPELAAHADPALAKVVLENLIGNAWKYTSKTTGARIEIGSEAGEFFVRDNGAGFDPRYAAKLFEPFERLHGPEEFPGTGIGLATVERIVRRHGGQVGAASTPGKGATFRFSFGGGA